VPQKFAENVYYKKFTLSYLLQTFGQSEHIIHPFPGLLKVKILLKFLVDDS